MRRRDFLLVLVAAITGCARQRVLDKPERTNRAEVLRDDQVGRTKPNILLIVADDLGYGELGCYGGRDVPTPNIDSLATDGTRFTNGYVTCPVCSPTRAALLTGRYQQRFGHEFNPGPEAGTRIGLRLDQATLAQVMKASGYATGLVGKWHLGTDREYRPTARGFDEFFGFLGGAHSYVNLSATDRAPIFRGSTPVDEDEYLTDAFAREACAFVDRHHAQPFFLYLAFNSIHTPLQAPQKYLDRFRNIVDPRRRTMCAMLSAMDDGVGRVLEKLREHGIEQDTLIFFISDNGGPTQGNTSRNDPLSGTKATVWEGGIRVPYLVRWMGHIPAGRTYESPVSSMDIFTTALVAAGVPPPRDRPMDGVNLLPALTGSSSSVPHDVLYWRFGEQWAIREGNHKLIKPPVGPARLFDLSVDVAEQHDLAAQRPQVAAELQRKYDLWSAQMQPPAWVRVPRRRAARRQARPPAATRPRG